MRPCLGASDIGKLTASAPRGGINVANVSDKQDLGTDSNPQNVEEHLARELLHYFTVLTPPGLNFEDQPQDVKELWLGAARVAMKALREASS